VSVAEYSFIIAVLIFRQLHFERQRSLDLPSRIDSYEMLRTPKGRRCGETVSSARPNKQHHHGYYNSYLKASVLAGLSHTVQITEVHSSTKITNFPETSDPACCRPHGKKTTGKRGSNDVNVNHIRLGLCCFRA
jgi:hypothetical protein